MAYKGYSFNLHREDDKELIEWLSDKKVTKTIKTALYNQMKAESGGTTEDNPMELLSAIKKVIESNGVVVDEPQTVEKKEVVDAKQDDNAKSLSGEDVDDFEKIFDV